MDKTNKISTLYKLAFPAMVSHATVMFIGIIDLSFISGLPNPAVAISGAAMANNICISIYCFLEGIRSGTTVLIGKFHSAKEYENISKTINLGIFVATLAGITVWLLTPILPNIVFSIFKDQQVISSGKSYLFIRMLGVPFHLVIFAILGLFRGLKNTFVPFLIALTSCTSNIILNYILGPRMGLNGIALATALSYIVSLIVSIILMVKLPISRKYINFKIPFNSVKSVSKLFLKISAEIGLYAGILVITMAIFVSMFSYFDPRQFAALQIAFQVFLASYLPLMGFFVATTILISKVLGLNNHKKIPAITAKIWVQSIPLIGGLNLIIAFFAPDIARFFSPEDTYVASLATKAIYIICITQIFSSAYLVLKGAMTAIKDTTFLLIAGTITSFVLFLPLSYLLGITLNYGIFGGYFAILIWTISDTIIFSIRFFLHKPFKKRI